MAAQPGLVRRHSSAFERETAERWENVGSEAAASSGASSSRKRSTCRSGSASPADEGMSARGDGDGSSGASPVPDRGDGDEDGSVEFKSCLNSNVIFRSSHAGGRSARGKLKNRTSKERFLTSIEHWTLASEGLRRSICDLGADLSLAAADEVATEAGWSAGHQNGGSSSVGAKDSLDPSGSFGMEVSRLLEDLSQTAAQIRLEEEDGAKSTSSSGVESLERGAGSFMEEDSIDVVKVCSTFVRGRL